MLYDANFISMVYSFILCETRLHPLPSMYWLVDYNSLAADMGFSLYSASFLLHTHTHTHTHTHRYSHTCSLSKFCSWAWHQNIQSSPSTRPSPAAPRPEDAVVHISPALEFLLQGEHRGSIETGSYRNHKHTHARTCRHTDTHIHSQTHTHKHTHRITLFASNIKNK